METIMATNTLTPGAAPANPAAHQPSRRALLGALAAAPIVALPIPAAGATSSDWNAALAEVERCTVAVRRLTRDWPDGSAQEEAFGRAVSAQGDAINHLIRTPSPDLSGVGRKIELIRDNFGNSEEGELDAILADVRRLAGEA
jgi:hypothetical protein